MVTEQTGGGVAVAKDLMAVNLVAALITAFLMGSSLLLLVVAAAFEGGSGWVAFLAVFVIIVQMSAAMICVWHNHVPEHQKMMRKVMGLISWIMTGVSLFFLLVIMLAFPVALFAVSDEASRLF